MITNDYKLILKLLQIINNKTQTLKNKRKRISLVLLDNRLRFLRTKWKSSNMNQSLN